MRRVQHLLVEDDPLQALRASLLAGLRSGAWPPGSRLPTERALCRDHGVSRSALRRVLRELREAGLIVQKVGSGTYVADTLAATRRAAAGAAHSLSVPAVSPAELMESRLLLEPAMVDLIVNNATMDDFDRLQACCDRCEAAPTLEAFEHHDGALHHALAQATHNAVFISIFALLSALRESHDWGHLHNKVLSHERREVLQREHRRIVQALQKRDADTARRELFDHLAEAREKLLWRLRGR